MDEAPEPPHLRRLLVVSVVPGVCPPVVDVDGGDSAEEARKLRSGEVLQELEGNDLEQAVSHRLDRRGFRDAIQLVPGVEPDVLVLVEIRDGFFGAPGHELRLRSRRRRSGRRRRRDSSRVLVRRGCRQVHDVLPPRPRRGPGQPQRLCRDKLNRSGQPIRPVAKVHAIFRLQHRSHPVDVHAPGPPERNVRVVLLAGPVRDSVQHRPVRRVLLEPPPRPPDFGVVVFARLVVVLEVLRRLRRERTFLLLDREREAEVLDAAVHVANALQAPRNLRRHLLQVLPRRRPAEDPLEKRAREGHRKRGLVQHAVPQQPAQGGVALLEPRRKPVGKVGRVVDAEALGRRPEQREP